MMPISHQRSGLAAWYERLARAAFYVMIFAIPLAYFPWTIDQLEFNKQTILLIFTSLSVIAWLGLMVARRSFVFKINGVFIFLGLFLLGVLLSSAFSISPYLSWVGHSSQEYTSFLTFLSLGLLLFVGTTFLTETGTQRTVWSLAVLTSSVIGLIVVLAAFGWPLLSTSFIGTPNALGFYLVAMATIASGLLLTSGRQNRDGVLPDGLMGFLTRLACLVTVMAAVIILLMLDYWLLWVALLLGVCSTFAFIILRKEDFPSVTSFILPMALLVFSLIFLALPSPLAGRLPGEVSPTFGASWSIATQTLSDSSIWLGSGPGTFVMDYTKFHDPLVNDTALWDARFDRSASQAMTVLATLGVLGLATFLILMFWIGGSGLNQLLRVKNHEEWKMTFIAFSGWLVMALSFFFYSWNLSLTFLYFLLSAVVIAQSSSPIKEWSFVKSPRLSLATTFMFVLSSVGLLTILFISLSRYGAEIAFARAVSADRSGQSIDEVISDLGTAARLNRWNDVYYRNLANAFLVKLGEVSRDPEVKASDVQSLVSASINSARQAVDLSPSQVVNWSLLGDVYREVAPIVGGADAFAVEAYEKAVELAPTNPKYYVVLGRAHLVTADLQSVLLQSEDATTAAQAKADRDTALGLAVVSLQKAIDLQASYAPAHYYLAAAYERQGNLSEAIAKMETLREVAPNDVGVSFQLGMLYLRQGKLDLAQAELERAITISPNFSNALWFLSAIYEQKGDLTKAIELVKEVEKYNPDTPAVEQRLERLEAGQQAAELPDPLEETSSEIVE